LSICFFLQAEDRIRDRNVTGVQTCALPIYEASRFIAADVTPGRSAPEIVKSISVIGAVMHSPVLVGISSDPGPYAIDPAGTRGRSEERRVGKGQEGMITAEIQR